MGYKDKIVKLDKTNQEKIENNKIKSLENRLMISEKIIYTMQEQLKLERDVIDTMSHRVDMNSVLMLALTLFYLFIAIITK